MPNIKSAVKRVRTQSDRRANNIAFKSEMRSAIKTFEAKVEAKDVEAAKTALNQASKRIDKAADKGIIHRNTVARKKSRLTKMYNEISA
ncbi:30S ribosomal protein S20 [Bacillus hwajinpoensis]|uniref:Small ribosomal subunit protein bS20 n=1 Tax=Guptibacillus hwajinpoensis TaxID=208199 RepID=A0A845EWU2_9BACL|nr:MULTISPECIES: 30S ribosomal protein S20 [Bacillaceae]MCA0992873.1 30S ribosomal protein S20 [Pseudalkalibacillus hwajinpoensis]MYL63007.1 30S ribosomal protein S20 [Pseudalkalibacillus hwajinpoensis]PFG13988.1 SSU ribosomal protein S20P [Bacillus sp. es.036]QHA92655.1 30S ribosomal protein S20 [Bacillus sp. N1-1]